MADTDTTIYQPPKPDPELRQLNFLVGKWQLEGVMKEGVFGPAAKTNGLHSWEWFNEYFMVHRWKQDIGEGIEYIGYDAPNKRFFTHYFDNNGPYDEEGSTYEGELRGKSLVFCGPARITYTPSDDGKTIAFRSDMSSKQQRRQGLEAPDSDWEDWLSGTFTRIDE